VLAIGHLAGSKDASRAGAAAVQALVLTVGVAFSLKAAGRSFARDAQEERRAVGVAPLPVARGAGVALAGSW
jgi:hypothetical protein